MKTTTIDWQEYGKIMEQCTAYCIKKRPSCRSPQLVADLIAPLMEKHEGQEAVYLLALNARMELIGAPHLVTLGTSDMSLICPRDIFRNALEMNATGIIIAHNHPSGTRKPSLPDLQATKKVEEAGRMIGIPLYDHVIIPMPYSGDYCSLRAEKYLTGKDVTMKEEKSK